MADWVTISALGTAGGTLVLAVATYGSVRSANRAARTAEDALREQRRPVVVHSRLDDPLQKIMFGDQHWSRVPGGHASVEYADGVVYLTMSLRNVGQGIGVLRGWYLWGGESYLRTDPRPIEEFRPQTRDLLIPAGDVGLWQGALRDASEDVHRDAVGNVRERRLFAIDLLYSDQTGAQRAISRFTVAPTGDEEGWLVSLIRHWDLEDEVPERRSRPAS